MRKEGLWMVHSKSVAPLVGQTATPKELVDTPGWWRARGGDQLEVDSCYHSVVESAPRTQWDLLVGLVCVCGGGGGGGGWKG